MFRAYLQNVCGVFASILFPAACRLCGDLLDTATRIPICRSCLASLQPLSLPSCRRCGRPFASPVALQVENLPLCHICRRGLYDFDFARSYGAYTEGMTRSIMLLKYEGVTPLAAWFAAALAKTFHRHPELCPVDVVVPVPTNALRFRERGYNHAELIAKPLARSLELPCRSYLLVRSRPRPDKLKLTLRERWRSVRGAYTIRHGLRVDNLRVLLVDDVLTTGATLDACSRALRKGGAARVVALTVARAISRRDGISLDLSRGKPDA